MMCATFSIIFIVGMGISCIMAYNCKDSYFFSDRIAPPIAVLIVSLVIGLLFVLEAL